MRRIVGWFLFVALLALCNAAEAQPGGGSYNILYASPQEYEWARSDKPDTGFTRTYWRHWIRRSISHNHTNTQHNISFHPDVWFYNDVLEWNVKLNAVTQTTGNIYPGTWITLEQSSRGREDMVTIDDDPRVGAESAETAAPAYCSGLLSPAESGNLLRLFTSGSQSISGAVDSLEVGPGEVLQGEYTWFYRRDNLGPDGTDKDDYDEDEAPIISLQYWKYTTSSWDSNCCQSVYDTDYTFNTDGDIYQGCHGTRRFAIVVSANLPSTHIYDVPNDPNNAHRIKFRFVQLMKDDGVLWHFIAVSDGIELEYYPEE